jgi:hypothetical protein
VKGMVAATSGNECEEQEGTSHVIRLKRGKR